MIRSLFTGAIDYAGLFPPAALAMDDAVRRFATYRRGPDAWALGRFVVQANALAALAAAAAALPPVPSPHDEDGRPWRISALLGGAAADDLAAVGAFNDAHGEGGAHRPAAWRAVVDAVEVRVADGAAVTALPEVPPSIEAFVELPAADDPLPLLEAVASRGYSAKIRTGGVTADAFPTARRVARFIHGCAGLGLRFKATAGLHHPLRAEHRLTYAPDSARATMFGFLNVLLATATAREGASEDDLVAILEEGDAAGFAISSDGAAWDGHQVTPADAAAMRRELMVAFGSCSFEEPLADLRSLHLL